MLTRAEATALEFIAGHIRDSGGVSPSYDEIQGALGWKSKCRIGFLLDDLEAKGRIRRLAKRARAIEVIEDHAPKSLMRFARAQFYKWNDESQKLVPWRPE